MNKKNRENKITREEDNEWVQDPEAGVKGGYTEHNKEEKEADIKDGNVAM